MTPFPGQNFDTLYLSTCLAKIVFELCLIIQAVHNFMDTYQTCLYWFHFISSLHRACYALFFCIFAIFTVALCDIHDVLPYGVIIKVERIANKNSAGMRLNKSYPKL